VATILRSKSRQIDMINDTTQNIMTRWTEAAEMSFLRSTARLRSELKIRVKFLYAKWAIVLKRILICFMYNYFNNCIRVNTYITHITTLL
jgi:hypothetical protein